MKTLKIALFLLSLVVVLDSCKKGEDDPFVSLRSRKARIVGAWKMTSMKSTFTSTYSGITTSNTYTSNGSTYTLTETFDGSSETMTGTETLEFEFKKDGSYTAKCVRDGDSRTEEGQWNFTSGVGELKNKSQLTMVSKSNTNTYGTSSSTGNYFNSTLDIKELRHKKIVLAYEVFETNPGSTSTNNYELVLEPK